MHSIYLNRHDVQFSGLEFDVLIEIDSFLMIEHDITHKRSLPFLS